MRSMPESTPVPSLTDAKALIERLRPNDRAMLRLWVLAKLDVQRNAERRVGEPTRVDEDGEGQR